MTYLTGPVILVRRMTRKIIFNIILVVLVPFILVSQHVGKESMVIDQRKTYNLSFQLSNSIVVKCNSCEIVNGYFLADGDTLPILSDPHEPQSALVIFPNAVEGVSFYSGRMMGGIELFFINAGSVSNKSLPNQRIYENKCENTAIPPEIWRDGLEAPSYTPDVTEVEHVVIHHSATTNDINDPYAAVRSIYIYHTQVNGWSDIGYNYLVAPDGTVFQGRDDMGLADPDNIIGAHMCGVNSNTMGICVIGNFTEQMPTENALDALAELVKWKTEKDDIPIFGRKIHAIGPGSANLPPQNLAQVCGHREGCRPSYTECPGNTLFENLETIKLNASEKVCQSEGEIISLLAYPNPSDDFVKVDFLWDYLEIIDVRGSLIQSYSSQQDEVFVGMLSRGVYLFAYHTEEHGKLVQKIIRL